MMAWFLVTALIAVASFSTAPAHMYPAKEQKTLAAKLDFGQPGVYVQAGFIKIGKSDAGAGSFTGTFPCSGSTCTIKISGFTHTRGRYNPVVNKYAGLSNLLRSSFLRNSAGTMTVDIYGLMPSSKYEVKTYHHTTATSPAQFTLQYDDGKVNQLKQDAGRTRPNPPLTHAEIVTSSAGGRISFTMIHLRGGHMDLNGMLIWQTAKMDVSSVARLDFGQPGRNEQSGFLKLGRSDAGAGTYSMRFPCHGKTCTVKVSGYTHTRGNYGAVTNKYADVSNLLRSSFLRSGSSGTMTTDITGLKPSTEYEIKTYHHCTATTESMFRLQYDGKTPYTSPTRNGRTRPTGTFSHKEIVKSSAGGRISFAMTQLSNGHMDLNGLEIWETDITDITVALLDFGQPGIYVQPGFYKVGRTDAGAGSFTGTFPCEGRTCTIKISGYTHTRGRYATVVNKYSSISNLLRSSFLRNSRGRMTTDITGLKPNHEYQITTYHHSTSGPGVGVALSLQYDGNPVHNLKQSNNGRSPNPPLIHTETVKSSIDGRISLVMIGGGSGHMDLNGLEIRNEGDCQKDHGKEKNAKK